MNPVFLMQISGVAMVAFGIATIVNFAILAKKGLNNSGTGFGIQSILHVVFGGLASLSGMGLVAGFIWFLVEILAK
jgi:hypothetical protein